MVTYIILNALVLLGLLALVTFRPASLSIKKLALLALLLLILTAIFDSLIIVSGIVAYDTSKISGLYIGKAPIEDFAYALAVILLVPYIWVKSCKHDK